MVTRCYHLILAPDLNPFSPESPRPCARLRCPRILHQCDPSSRDSSLSTLLRCSRSRPECHRPPAGSRFDQRARHRVPERNPRIHTLREATDATLGATRSTSLGAFSNNDVLLQSSVLDDVTQIRTNVWRSTLPLGSIPREFLRVRPMTSWRRYLGGGFLKNE